MKNKGMRMVVVIAAMVLLATQFVVAAEKKEHNAHEQAPAVATAPAAAPSAGHGDMKMGMMEHMGGMIPADKKDAFDAIEAKFKAQVTKLHQDVYAKNAELTGALAASSVDEAKTKALSKELNGLYAQLNDIETEKRLEMRKQGIPFGPYMQPHHGKMGGGMMGGKSMSCPMMQNMQGMQHGQPAAPPAAPATETKK